MLAFTSSHKTSPGLRKFCLSLLSSRSWSLAILIASLAATSVDTIRTALVSELEEAEPASPLFSPDR